VIVAIDGPAGSGKSAVGRRVAEALELPFVDSGLMYRAIAHLAFERGVDMSDGAALTRLASGVRVRIDGRRVWVDGEEYTDQVYSPELSEGASRVAKVAGVRLALVAQQRALGRHGVVMAGRDIGTVVFPDADLKIFLVADPWERARRRLTQRLGRRPADDEIAEETERLVQRDARDATQTVQARDAVIIDTTYLTQAEQVERIVALAKAVTHRGSDSSRH
jgi:cytidylate kinase